MSGTPQIVTGTALALTEPRATWYTNKYAVLAVGGVGSSLIFMNNGISTVALAAIGQTLKLSPLQLQWTINAELLPVAALTLVFGAVGDRYGQKIALLTGLILFALGTGGIYFASSWSLLLICRFLQGVGGALVIPSSLAVIGQAFPSELKAFAVGIWSSSAAIASGVGPAVAGAVLEHGSWKTTFLMLVPLAALAFGSGLFLIPKGRGDGRKRIDVVGAVLSTVGLAALGMGLTALTNGPAGTPLVIGPIALGILALVALVCVEFRRGDRALLPPSLFMARSVVGANLYTVLLYGPFTVVLTLVPYVMIRGAHFSTVIAGVAFLPLQLSVTFLSPLAGTLCRITGRRPPLFIGAAIIATACISARFIGSTATYWLDVFPSILLLALGFGIAAAPLTTLVLTSVEPARAGIASGVNNAMSCTGSLLAVAMLGGVLQQGGSPLIDGFHTAMTGSAVCCGLAVLAAFIIERGPHVDYVPVD